jgi:hypothetical protein
VCYGKLRPETYATINDQFYCKTHYDAAYNKAGGYDFAKLDGGGAGEGGGGAPVGMGCVASSLFADVSICWKRMPP